MARMSQHEQSHAVKGTSRSRSRDTGNDSWQRSKNPTRNDHGSKANTCKLCDTTHAARNCPAYGRSCKNAQPLCTMLQYLCQRKADTEEDASIHTIKPGSNNQADGNMFVYTVLNSRNREWHAVLDISNRGLKVKIDTRET